MKNKIEILTDINNYDYMINLLNEDGIFIVENYISGDELTKLHDEILDKCKTEASNYEFGRNYRGPGLNSFNKNSSTYKTFNKDWMRNLYNQYFGKNDKYCSSIFATWDYKNDSGLARNGWLHFDRGRCLKFFIYLTDIDEYSGAFSCCPGSRSKGEELRETATENSTNYGDILNRIELDYRDLLDVYPCVPVEGKAGTLIVFDTDAFHKGGLVEDGKSRLVVRAHCT